MNADNVTILAFIIGIISTVFIYFDHLVMAVLLLWISGFLDAVDGTMTRMQGNSTPIGTLMDITFDRIVELSIIITLAIKFDHTRLDMLILVSCILISMTIFLTVGALSKVKGVKSFYYQAGLAEKRRIYYAIAYDFISKLSCFYHKNILYNDINNSDSARS